MTEDITVNFVIRKDCENENDCSEDMQLAFITCEQHRGGGLKARWIKEKGYNQYIGLSKKDVFVLNEFAGEIFDRLRSTRCLIVGPRCLSCCLTEGTPIPHGPEPVFTIAMRGLTVTASGLSKQQKENIKRRVHWMGGTYTSTLTEATTHLVSDTVISDKYIIAVEKRLPVMSEAWIEAVWTASLQLNVNGGSPEFDKYRLPPFYNLQVTTSGLSKSEKNLIMKLVNQNGGSFSGTFQSEVTDVIVLTKEGVGSEKYKAGIEYGKACVLPTWVKESAERGVALPLAKYRVAGASTSSPLAEHRIPDMSLNFSCITKARAPSNFVDETRSSDMSTMSGKLKPTQEMKMPPLPEQNDINKEFDDFDMTLIKKAGPIFDGFCIWVYGSEGPWREKASACVSRGGGVRYDHAHERVTHIVCDSAMSAREATRSLPSVPVINARWLIASVHAKKALYEADFLFETKHKTPAKKTANKPTIEPASPMSKRNLQLLRTPLNLPPPEAEPVVEPPQDDIVNHYLSQNLSQQAPREKTPERSSDASVKQPEITDDGDEESAEIEQIFRGISFEIDGLDEDALVEIESYIKEAGGNIVERLADYTLMPLDPDYDSEIHDKCVTMFWLKDCLSQQELLPIQYYHRPVRLPPGANTALVGVVASLSTYSGVERLFLDELAILLGATTQLRFCRRNTANALASTHLLCPTPTGDKYLGAVKWSLPAVTADWLLKCAELGRRISAKDYLVGDTKAPPSPEKKSLEEVPVDSKSAAQDVDKENEMQPPVEVQAQRKSTSSSDMLKVKIATEDENRMSPASRYIAMARQGLLGGESQETPKKDSRISELKEEARQGQGSSLMEGDSVRTPPIDDALSTPNLRAFSPTTRRRLQAIKRGEMPSDTIKTPTELFKNDIVTPDSAFGAALRPGSAKMSAETRKRLWQFVDGLPGKQESAVKNKETPISEIRNRFLNQFNQDSPVPEQSKLAPRKLHLQDQSDTPPAKTPRISVDQSPSTTLRKQISIESNEIEITDDISVPSEVEQMSVDEKSAEETGDGGKANSSMNAAVDAQLQRLSAALTGRVSSPALRQRRVRDSRPLPGPDTEAAPESQPNTVGWDDTTPTDKSVQTPTKPFCGKRFMLSSNVDNREELLTMIQDLGGDVCEGTELDPEATHLLCATPTRSEKMLGAIAAGKWTLHPAYVVECHRIDRVLPEEDFEWGNDRAKGLPTLSGNERTLAAAAFRWRYARSCGRPGPFSGVVALIHAPAARRRLLARLVLAGDGSAPDIESPYCNDDITVCFADLKRCPLSERDSNWLKSRKIPVCAPVLLSSYLTDDPRPDPRDHCLPEYKC